MARALLGRDRGGGETLIFTPRSQRTQRLIVFKKDHLSGLCDLLFNGVDPQGVTPVYTKIAKDAKI
jgi:hypothetical protein